VAGECGGAGRGATAITRWRLGRRASWVPGGSSSPRSRTDRPPTRARCPAARGCRARATILVRALAGPIRLRRSWNRWVSTHAARLTTHPSPSLNRICDVQCLDQTSRLTLVPIARRYADISGVPTDAPSSQLRGELLLERVDDLIAPDEERPEGMLAGSVAHDQPCGGNRQRRGAETGGRKDERCRQRDRRESLSSADRFRAPRRRVLRARAR
jgi:hypothetical protein